MKTFGADWAVAYLQASDFGQIFTTKTPRHQEEKRIEGIPFDIQAFRGLYFLYSTPALSGRILGDVAMTNFNDGKPFEGSEKIKKGNLKGTTDTDWFYFICPDCHEVFQILDFLIEKDGAVEYAREVRPKAKRDFKIAFELWCSKCNLHDFVKVSNFGCQGGKLKSQRDASL